MLSGDGFSGDSMSIAIIMLYTTDHLDYHWSTRLVDQVHYHHDKEMRNVADNILSPKRGGAV